MEILQFLCHRVLDGERISKLYNAENGQRGTCATTATKSTSYLPKV